MDGWKKGGPFTRVRCEGLREGLYEVQQGSNLARSSVVDLSDLKVSWEVSWARSGPSFTRYEIAAMASRAMVKAPGSKGCLVCVDRRRIWGVDHVSEVEIGSRDGGSIGV